MSDGSCLVDGSCKVLMLVVLVLVVLFFFFQAVIDC